MENQTYVLKEYPHIDQDSWPCSGPVCVVLVDATHDECVVVCTTCGREFARGAR